MNIDLKRKRKDLQKQWVSKGARAWDPSLRQTRRPDPVADEEPGVVDIIRETCWEVQQWWLDQQSRTVMAGLTAEERELWTVPRPFVKPTPAEVVGGMAETVRSRRVKVRVLPRETRMTESEFKAAVARAGGRICA